MNGFLDIGSILLGQVIEIELFPIKPLLYITGGVVGLVAIIYFVKSYLNRTHYEIDGSYGGGPGLRRFFKHKRLRSYDREGLVRGKAISFKDNELERLLTDDKLSEAAMYLTGVLNAAKEVGDEFTLERYAKYSEEIIGRYDGLEEDNHGGKALRAKK